MLSYTAAAGHLPYLQRSHGVSRVPPCRPTQRRWLRRWRRPGRATSPSPSPWAPAGSAGPPRGWRTRRPAGETAARRPRPPPCVCLRRRSGLLPKRRPRRRRHRQASEPPQITPQPCCGLQSRPVRRPAQLQEPSWDKCRQPQSETRSDRRPMLRPCLHQQHTLQRAELARLLISAGCAEAQGQDAGHRRF